MARTSPYFVPLYLLTLFGGAMVLGPVIYYAMGLIKPIPFHQAMDRALLVSALAGLGLIGQRLTLRQWWPWNGAAWRQLLLGYLMAAVTAQAILGFALAGVGYTSAHLDAHEAAKHITTAVVAALLVPPLEETLFRGFLQRELTGSLGWRAGWVVTALVYMLSHFLKVPTSLDHEPVHPWSGINAIGAAFLPLVHGDFISGRGLNLFLLGLILGGIVQRNGGILWLNAGLHSGLVLTVLLFTGFARLDEPPRVGWLGGDMLSSPITSMVFVLLGLWVWAFYRHPSVLPESGPSAP